MSRRGHYAVVGLVVAPGPQPGVSERMLCAEAVRPAIQAAGLTRSDIDSAIDAAGLFASLVITVVMVLIGFAVVNIFQRGVLRWQQG